MLYLPEGLIPSVYTPFTPDNRLNENMLADELRRVSKGCSGLIGPANMSELVSLTFEEWKAWIDVLVDVAHGGNLKAWAFFGGESFEKALPYAKHAIEAGADVLLLMTPHFNLYSQEAAYSYYKDFTSEFPETSFCFYPSHQTGNHFTPATIARVAELPNVVTMKLNGDSSYDEVSRIILLTKDIKHFRPVPGGLNVLYPLMKGVDIKASLSAFSPFAHDWSLNLWNAYLAQDWAGLEKWQKKLAKVSAVLNSATDRHVGARAGHKAALELLGRPHGPPRRPGIPASEEHVARIRQVLEEEGLLERRVSRAA